MPAPALRERREQRRAVRDAARRRRRGGVGRGPVALQRLARGSAASARALGRGVRQLVRGDRPLFVVLAGACALAVVLLSGPAQSYLDARTRVELLDDKATLLAAENARLEQRMTDLADPEVLELLAREQQGFIRPGEVPYRLVPPEVDRPRITAPRGGAEPPPAPIYRRVWDAVAERFG